MNSPTVVELEQLRQKSRRECDNAAAMRTTARRMADCAGDMVTRTLAARVIAERHRAFVKADSAKAA